MRQRSYYDVMLTPRVSWWQRLRRRGAYYPTAVRRLPSGRVEVTLQLPPSILNQWQRAIRSGKRIRLFVP